MKKRTPKGEALASVMLEIFRVNGEILELAGWLARPEKVGQLTVADY